MIYSPTQLLPNNTSVDATNDITLSWKVTGQFSYRVLVYKNSDNSSIIDTGQITSTDNFYIITSGTLSNGIIYKFQVIVTDATTTATSNFSLFRCNTTPTLQLSATPTASQTYDFEYLYTQVESVPVKSYIMTLYDVSATPLVVSDTLYPIVLTTSPSNPLLYTFDGMETSTTYGIGCIVTTQYDVEVDSGITYFTINYTQPTTIPELVITSNDNEGSIQLDWTKMKQILGTVVGSYSYVSGQYNKAIQLNSGSYLYYDEYIPNNFTVVYWINIDVAFNGDLIKFGTDDTGMRVFYTDGRFGFQLDNFITVGAPLAVSTANWIKLGITYAKLIVQTPTITQVIAIYE